MIRKSLAGPDREGTAGHHLILKVFFLIPLLWSWLYISAWKALVSYSNNITGQETVSWKCFYINESNWKIYQIHYWSCIRIAGTSTLSNNLVSHFIPWWTDCIIAHAAEMLIFLWQLSFGTSWCALINKNKWKQKPGFSSEGSAAQELLPVGSMEVLVCLHNLLQLYHCPFCTSQYASAPIAYSRTSTAYPGFMPKQCPHHSRNLRLQ